MKNGFVKKISAALLALLLAVCLSATGARAEDTSTADEAVTGKDGWVNFLLICNEGMNNDKGNAGNTLMVVSMHPDKGAIRLMMFTWDTFVDYAGYDVPQKLDMPYRSGGAEEAMKVFNANFGTDIHLYMSLNYLNLAGLIDDFGGVDVDISRAERNALNGMVASKKNQLQAQVDSGILSQAVVEMLAQEYYLTDFGPQTHLNGLQAVGFGWLQYDSVYNCCEREVEVIAALFRSVGADAAEKIAFYTDASGEPEDVGGKRIINLDHITEEDYAFLRQEMSPIFDKSYNNLSEDEITAISTALAKVAYQAARSGVNIFDHLDTMVLPLEAQNPYDIVAGAKGHLIDQEANRKAVEAFLYPED